jgi:two-component system KDP operon response regulator KdpE
MGILDKLMIFAAGKDAEGKIPVQATTNLPKIMIVEADPALKAQYILLLPADKYSVSSSVNGAEALNMLLTFQPSIILIDLNLPVMDGKELLHHIRAIPEYKVTPVLVVSDKGDIDTIRQVKLYDGAKGFLIKENVTPEQTIATLLDLM